MPALMKSVTFIQTPVAAATTFVADDCVCYNTSGLAAVPADTTGFVFAGFAGQDVDNSAGAASAKNVPIVPVGPDNRFFRATKAAAVQADVGELAYFTATNTVSLSAGNGVKAGLVVAILSTTTVLIDALRGHI